VLAVLAAAGCGTREDYATLLEAQRGGPAVVSVPQAQPAAVSLPQAAGPTQPAAVASAPSAIAGSVVVPTAGKPVSATVNKGKPVETGTQHSAAPPSTVTRAAVPAATAAQAPVVCTGAQPQIVIGSVGQQSGLIGSIVGTGALAVQAWAASVNANGGLNCHPIKYILADDGADPSRHQALVQQLVEQDHAIAFVQMDAVLTGSSSVQYLSDRHIPVIGAEGGSDWFYTSPYYFPQSAQGIPTLESVVAAGAEVGRQYGAHKMGVLACIEGAICSKGYDTAPQNAVKYGMTLAYRAQASLTQPDFTAICQAAKSSGVEVFDIYMDGNSLQRLLQSCTSVGFKPHFLAQSLGLTRTVPDDPLADGVYGSIVAYPWMLTSNPAVAAFSNVLLRFAPGLKPDSGAMQGWVSAQIFQYAATRTTGPVTSASILEGLWTVKQNTFGGLTQALTYTEGKTAPHEFCWWLIQIQHKAYTSPDGGRRTCGTF
jgi:branched-chain amino acid transport system substrate-binding protein